MQVRGPRGHRRQDPVAELSWAFSSLSWLCREARLHCVLLPVGGTRMSSVA